MSGRLKAVIEYDGTDFFGWQIQKDRRTVQGVLEEILAKRCDRPVSIMGAGRTDKGVHAAGQAAHFDVPFANFDSRSPKFDSKPSEIHRFRSSLNEMLPPDITIRSLEEVPDDFHARFSAVCRTYRYDIRLSYSALSHRYCWEVVSSLRIARMRIALAFLKGRHSFKPLAKLNPDEKHYRCTILDVSLKKKHDYLLLHIKADRFLHGMVRAITGTLVDVGRKAKEPDIFKCILESSDRSLVSTLAPARGLFLEHIQY